MWITLGPYKWITLGPFKWITLGPKCIIDTYQAGNTIIFFLTNSNTHYPCSTVVVQTPLPSGTMLTLWVGVGFGKRRMDGCTMGLYPRQCCQTLD